MSQEFIYNHGCNIVDQLKEKRQFFNFNEELFEKFELTSNINHPFIQDCIRQQKLPIDSTMHIEVAMKVGHVGWAMGWHKDDTSVFKNSKQHSKKYDVGKYSFYSKKHPLYTLVLYMNTYGEDFFGGEFCFVDLEFKPMKGIAIFFDSREVHQVKKVVSGIRQSCVVKFYN